MLSIILLTPLLSFLTLFFFGRFFNSVWAAQFAIYAIAAACIASIFNFALLIVNGAPLFYNLGHWFTSGLLVVDWEFVVDLPSAAMACIVTLVSFCVNLYSREYMKEDPFFTKFFAFLALFSFFMLLLVCADNFVLLFFGWEGVGLVSYLLVGYWTTRRAASAAAIKAVLVNRIGDFGLLFGILLCICYTGSASFSTVFMVLPHLNETVMLPWVEIATTPATIIAFSLLLGVAGKSAQFCLHTWLPDAMEGPTPVSALLHAATMVTAGVFILIRCNPIFELAPQALATTALLGAATAFFASTVGWFQNDLKKVVAFSTCSQLGYMLVAAGMSNYPAALLHLVNHAFFKALLFLSAGSVIHALGNEQDMRRMGGLAKSLPFTHLMMLFGSLSLAGLPFLTGFYSKEAILEHGLIATQGLWFYTGLLTLVAVVVAVGSALYSVRSLYLVFYAKPSFFRAAIANIHEPPHDMRNAMLILWVGTISAGLLTHQLLLDPWLWIRTAHLGLRYEVAAWYLDAHFLVPELPNSLRLLPLCGAVLGGYLGYMLAKHAGSIALNRHYIADLMTFSSGKWLFDWLYNLTLLSKGFGSFAYQFAFKTFDRGVVELLGPLGLTRITKAVARQLTTAHTGSLYRHMLTMVVGLLLFSLVGTFSPFQLFTDDAVFNGLLVVLIWLFLIRV